jgi:four helix bundle protein
MSDCYQDLIAWQKAIALAEYAYELTEAFPKREMYGLARQVRNAAVSVPVNIAEGHGRITRGEWQQFLGIARGSLLEVETELILAARFKYIDQSQLQAAFSKSAEVGRLINGLLRVSGSRAPRKPFENR